MRTMRPNVARLAGIVAALLLAPLPTQAQETGATGTMAPAAPYYMTLHFGTGLINTPTAWVSPRSGDVWVNTSAKRILYYPDDVDATLSTEWNTNISLETHWFGRFTVGVTAYSQNPEWGFFGSLLVLRDGQFAPFLPGLLVGIRNVGNCQHEDRFLIGCDIVLEPADSTYTDRVAFPSLETRPTLYAVATKDLLFGGAMAGALAPSLSLSVGWGNGIFSESPDEYPDEFYNESGTIAKGLFLGGRFLMHPTPNTLLTVIGENDGWDWNAGVVGDWRGIVLGIYATEIEEGGERDPQGQIYNYRKWNASLGYSGNIYDIGRGILLRTRITDLTLEQQRLRAEIAERERRIRGLEITLNRARAGELADIARRREELEREVQAERDAIRRAEERLRQIQEGRQPPANPPQRTPPSTTTPRSLR